MPGLLAAKEQHLQHRVRLRHAVGLALGDLVDQAEDARLDELDQALEHLRLAGEVAVQRRFRHASFAPAPRW
jgi:hypothetical protein